MPTASVEAIAPVRDRVLQLLCDAPNHPRDVWLAARHRQPPGPGWVALGYLSTRLAGACSDARRFNLLRLALDELEQDGLVEVIRRRYSDAVKGRRGPVSRVVWVRLAGDWPDGPAEPYTPGPEDEPPAREPKKRRPEPSFRVEPVEKAIQSMFAQPISARDLLIASAGEPAPTDAPGWLPLYYITTRFHLYCAVPGHRLHHLVKQALVNMEARHEVELVGTTRRTRRGRPVVKFRVRWVRRLSGPQPGPLLPCCPTCGRPLEGAVSGSTS